jgi:glucokinase
VKLESDSRAVLTLDAGGTNFVFSAMRGGKEIVEPITYPSSGHDLDRCLATLLKGFEEVKQRLNEAPAAISFAFPGPADYAAGIIGDQKNLPGFQGGVALGPMLEDHFKIPVFISNDADLFTYGEAIAGLLPQVNEALGKAGSPKRFRSLFGITLGTGFGGGFVWDGRLYTGDNAAGAEVWCLRNKRYPNSITEEGASIRAVRREYATVAGIPFEQAPEPKVIFQIAQGEVQGNQAAALESFRRLGEVAGNAVANILAVTDSLVVVGGGLAGAASLILPTLVDELNGSYESVIPGQTFPRLEITGFNLEDPAQWQRFIQGDCRMITVPGSARQVPYDPLKRTGVGLTRLGTSRATAIGAYAFALSELDKR